MDYFNQNNFAIKKSYLAEVELTATPAAGQKILFKDVPQLRNKYIYGIEVFGETQLAVSPNGKTVVNTAQLANITVSLLVGSDERVVSMPLYTLLASANGGYIRTFNNMAISLTKCFITIHSATSLAINEAVPFNFYYQDKPPMPVKRKK